jgi:hypothetical protein
MAALAQPSKAKAGNVLARAWAGVSQRSSLFPFPVPELIASHDCEVFCTPTSPRVRVEPVRRSLESKRPGPCSYLLLLSLDEAEASRRQRLVDRTPVFLSPDVVTESIGGLSGMASM